VRDLKAVSSIAVSELAYSPPGAEQLFFDVSFGVTAGEHAAIVGPNGVGKSTILKNQSPKPEMITRSLRPSASPLPKYRPTLND